MLTKDEIEAAKAAEHWSTGWGVIRPDGKWVLDPVGMVAEKRGIHMAPAKGAPTVPGNPLYLTPPYQSDGFDSCCADVQEWLGFSTWKDYTEAFWAERQNILKRAKD